MHTLLKHPVFTFLLIVVVGFVVMHLLYYEHARSPEVLAEKLITEDRDAEDCFLFRTFDIGPRPTTYEMQMRCVYVYAKLTKNPTACELLLPSDYGWSCLGVISGKLFAGRLCTRSGSLEHIKVYCNRESEGELSIDRPQIDNCLLYERKDLREWCYDARTELLDNTYNCQQITQDAVRDHCEYSYALKLRDPQFCFSIKDKPRREFCEFRVDMMLKYP
ncbi:hypothetical protein KKF55_04280 [Patescibacteria group bacterium]|nr:hypothetical protein [Patescibacteria group bacterium]